MRFTLFLVLLALASFNFAATWYVNGTNESTCNPAAQPHETDNDSIQGAINAASDGDTIIVCLKNTTNGAAVPFNQSLPIVVNRSINLFGNQTGVIVNVTRFVQTTDPYTSFILNITAPNVNISNFTFWGPSVTMSISGVWVNASNVSIRDNNFTRLVFHVYVYNATNVSISGSGMNNSCSASGRGVFINWSTNATVTGNTITNISGFSIELWNSSNNTIVSNNMNMSMYGMRIFDGRSNNVSSNTAYNLSSSSLTLDNTHNNTCVDNLFYNTSSDVIEMDFSHNNTFLNNLLFNGSNNGFQITSSNYNTFVNNTLGNTSTTASSGAGFSMITSSYNNISTNIIYHNFRGILFDNVGNNNNNTVYNNTVFNNTMGIVIAASYDNNVSFNKIFNNSDYGIAIDTVYGASGGNRIFSNTIYNHTQGGAIGIIINSIYASANYVYGNTIQNSTYGIMVNSSNFTNVTNNDVRFISKTAFELINASNNTIAYNTLANGSTGIRLNLSSNNNITSNFVFNNSQYGFYVIGGNNNNLSSNNATNNAFAHYHFVSGANATLSGTNRALQTPANAFDLNITAASNVTTLIRGSDYSNFTTDYGSIFFHNAVNLSIRLVNLTASGAPSLGCTNTTGACTLITPSTNVVNITNTSGTAIINLGMFYNTGFGATSENIMIAKYSSSGWLKVGQTAINSAAGSIRYDGLPTFSTFGVVNFGPAPSPSSDSPSASSADITISDIGTAGTGTNGVPAVYSEDTLLVTADSGSGPISGMTVTLILYEPYEGVVQEILTDENGNALFDMSNLEQGRYKLEFSKPGYKKPADTYFTFVPPSGGQQSPQASGQPSGEGPGPVQPPSAGGQPQPAPQATGGSASQSISGADSAIAEALDEGKDVSAAQEKLNEAKAALEAGDYEKAASLAAEAAQLAKEATAPGAKPIAGKTQDSGPKTQQGGIDMGQLLIGLGAVAVIAVAAAGAYYLFGKKK